MTSSRAAIGDSGPANGPHTAESLLIAAGGVRVMSPSVSSAPPTMPFTWAVICRVRT